MADSVNAIFAADGKQWRAQEGTLLLMDKRPEPVGATIYFDQVLLLFDGGRTSIGAPCLAGARISGKIVGHAKGKKVVVFKKKRRKGYQKRQGHRQSHTEIIIEKITFNAQKSEVAKEEKINHGT